MCYDIKASLEAQLGRARRKGDQQAVKEILEKLIPISDLPIHHASGFSHPKLLIYTDIEPEIPTVATWGLVPHWVRDREQLKKIWNNTLNARSETIFEKPSFRDSAKNRRCLLYVDGFYEHHHFNGKTFPHYIYRKDKKPLIMAGLWSEWIDDESGEVLNTFSIVTTKGNEMMSKIHNNPKLKEPRMPLILLDALADEWLNPIYEEIDQIALEELMEPYPENELDSHTVTRLRGKEYIGNVANISDKFEYLDLLL